MGTADTRIKAKQLEALLIHSLELDMSDQTQERVRGRIKMLQRLGWPDTVKSDPDLRKGHTAGQFLRFLCAFVLQDAHYSPIDAVALVRRHEDLIFATIAAAMSDFEMAVLIEAGSLNSLRENAKERVTAVPLDQVQPEMLEKPTLIIISFGHYGRRGLSEAITRKIWELEELTLILGEATRRVLEAPA